MKLLAGSLLFLLVAPGLAAGQTRYIAFGDSITEGAGDEGEGEERGYPARLQVLLEERGVEATVENHGRGGETTAAGLTRLDEVLAGGGDVLLLMEGTNDVSRRISQETIRFNLDEMARKAGERGLVTVHATVVPRLPSANTDGSNQATAGLAAAVRDLAWTEDRDLVDPFEVFSTTPDLFEELYVGGSDRLHPNAAGYDLMSQVFADVLTDRDSVPPVTGFIAPQDEARDVAPDVTVEVRLYDFGEGIDLGATHLRVDGQEVDAVLDGDETGLLISYQPGEDFQGVVSVALRSQDLAVPANQLDRALTRFIIEGTVFLQGDLDEDGRVDGVDLVAFALRFGAQRGEGRYARFADFNDDGLIDGEDLALLAANFGSSSF